MKKLLLLLLLCSCKYSEKGRGLSDAVIIGQSDTIGVTFPPNYIPHDRDTVGVVIDTLSNSELWGIGKLERGKWLYYKFDSSSHTRAVLYFRNK